MTLSTINTHKKTHVKVINNEKVVNRSKGTSISLWNFCLCLQESFGETWLTSKANNSQGKQGGKSVKFLKSTSQISQNFRFCGNKRSCFAEITWFAGMKINKFHIMGHFAGIKFCKRLQKFFRFGLSQISHFQKICKINLHKLWPEMWNMKASFHKVLHGL